MEHRRLQADACCQPLEQCLNFPHELTQALPPWGKARMCSIPLHVPLRPGLRLMLVSLLLMSLMKTLAVG